MNRVGNFSALKNKNLVLETLIEAFLAETTYIVYFSEVNNYKKKPYQIRKEECSDGAAQRYARFAHVIMW